MYVYEKYTPKELSFTFEICSEAPNYRLDWKSDIFFYLNDTFAASYTSPSDFGGVRGKLNPDWWPDNSTQYGQLIKLTITDNGTYINGEYRSKLKLKEIISDNQNYLKFKIESSEKAKFVGGFNLFSKTFGNYEQDIIMSVLCR